MSWRPEKTKAVPAERIDTRWGSFYVMKRWGPGWSAFTTDESGLNASVETREWAVANGTQFMRFRFERATEGTLPSW